MSSVQRISRPMNRPDLPQAPAWHAPPAFEEKVGAMPSSRGFVAMLTAYRGTGGTARGDDLAQLLEDRRQGDFVSLARRIVAGDVFGFEWRHTFWIPMFQFNPGDLSVNPRSKQVLAELSNDFDGWALAAWFAEPSSWLGGAKPVDLLDSDIAAVLGAARADRFIAAG